MSFICWHLVVNQQKTNMCVAGYRAVVAERSQKSTIVAVIAWVQTTELQVEGRRSPVVNWT